MFQICLVQPAGAADINAVIPYRNLDEMFEPIAAVDPAKLQIHVFVSSTNKTVRAADITLTIASAVKGRIPVTLSTNGQILEFPLARELHRENPPVVSNQPRGSLRLAITIQIPPTDELTFRYARLGDGVVEMNKSIRLQAGLVMSLFAPKVQGVVFLFSKNSAGKAIVKIASATGQRNYTADRNGRIKLKLEKSLLAENPEVILSEKPNHIIPDLEDMK